MFYYYLYRCNIQDIIKILNERYTTKKYQKGVELDKETLEKIKEILTLSPSSLNLQPWEFILVKTNKSKELIKDAFIDYSMNLDSVLDCSLVCIFLKKNNLDYTHIKNVLEKENKDNRFSSNQLFENSLNQRLNVLNIEKEAQSNWIEKQIYLNVGHFVLATHLLGLNSTIMEGFDKNKIDQIFKLREKNLSSVIIVCLGYSDNLNDYNKKLKKSRLNYNDLIKEC